MEILKYKEYEIGFMLSYESNSKISVRLSGRTLARAGDKVRLLTLQLELLVINSIKLLGKLLSVVT